MASSPYTHKRVRHSEQFVRNLLREDINPIKNNVENRYDVDIMTSVGMLDVQYTTYTTPFVDFISVLKHKEHCVNDDGSRNHSKFWSQVTQLNKDIKVFQSMGYSIEEIYHCLSVYASKDMTPGKFMNDRYDYVAYVKYYDKSFDVEDFYILDLKVLRTLDDPRITLAFNIKNRWNSLNDFHHSAYIKFPDSIIRNATVTDQFLINDVVREQVLAS